MKKLLVPILAGVAAVGVAITLWLIFVETPIDRALKFNQKIFYWHVPHAFWLFGAVLVCGVSSLIFLKTRKGKWDDLALASAEVAALFGAVVLATGMIWGKAAWDVWWSWEKRLVMSLLLWLTLVGYILVRRFAGASADRLAAGLAVFATIGIPFIYVMVDADDRHPQAIQDDGSGGNVATLDPNMKLAFWLSVLTFFLWFVVLTASRVASARAEREARELHERMLDAGMT
jgi:heme exporter protein C